MAVQFEKQVQSVVNKIFSLKKIGGFGLAAALLLPGITSASFVGVTLVTSTEAPAQALPRAYEAEDASLSRDFWVADNHPDFSGTGFVDYVGEGSVEWTVDAGEGGAFLLSFRYALSTGERPLDIIVNGAVAASNLSFPATGAWDSWSAVETEVVLAPGVNIVSAQTRGSSGPNMDRLDASVAIPSVAIPSIEGFAPQEHEAEDASLSPGFQVAAKQPNFSGSGYVDYVGEGYVEWIVDVEEGGGVLLSFRYALSAGDRPLDIIVNGAVAASNRSFPATGSWDNWSSVEAEVTLNPGANIIRAQTRGSSGPNMDRLNASVMNPPVASFMNN